MTLTIAGQWYWAEASLLTCIRRGRTSTPCSDEMSFELKRLGTGLAP